MTLGSRHSSSGRRLGSARVPGAALFAVILILLEGAQAASPSPTPSPSVTPEAPTFSPVPSPGVSPAVSAGASPAGSPSPAASPSPPAPLNDGQKKQLLRQFARANTAEIEALKHRNAMDLKELEASHRARAKEWEEKEKSARRKFFAEHTQGPDRRQYVKDMQARREAFQKILMDEKAQRLREYEVRIKSMQDDQFERKKEFKQFLSRGERPPSRLWPH